MRVGRALRGQPVSARVGRRAFSWLGVGGPFRGPPALALCRLEIKHHMSVHDGPYLPVETSVLKGVFGADVVVSPVAFQTRKEIPPTWHPERMTSALRTIGAS